MYFKIFIIFAGFRILDSPPTSLGMKFGRALYTP